MGLKILQSCFTASLAAIQQMARLHMFAGAHLAAIGPAAAHLRVGRDQDAALPILGVDDLHVHHACAQLQKLQVVPATTAVQVQLREQVQFGVQRGVT
jgi:hypothetical protein